MKNDYKGKPGEMIFINYTHPFDNAPPTEILKDNGYIKLTKTYIAIDAKRYTEVYFIDAKGGFLLGQFNELHEAADAYEKLLSEINNEK